MRPFNFPPLKMPEGIGELRQQVRDFLKSELTHLSAAERAQSWTGFDAKFSARLGQQGWIGMVWPKAFGGGGRSLLERYAVLEELLVAGAPVGAHWIADRQSGALLLRFGTEKLQYQYLPAMARGELFFCIGMSEANAGSDLASVKTHATKVDGGWLINGSKLWTTNVDKAHMMIALVRTSKHGESRHAGLSQFLIDLKSPGVTINPIVDHTGASHFGEMFLTDVFVPDDMLLGKEGDGWKQVTAELALERSGPERYLSSYRLFHALLAATEGRQDLSDQTVGLVGSLAAELWTLRQMSISVVGQLARGETPATEAAIVKDLGAAFEQGLPHRVQATLGDDVQIDNHPALEAVLNYLLKASPSFSLRGGTKEILRNIIAKGVL